MVPKTAYCRSEPHTHGAQKARTVDKWRKVPVASHKKPRGKPGQVHDRILPASLRRWREGVRSSPPTTHLRIMPTAALVLMRDVQEEEVTEIRLSLSSRGRAMGRPGMPSLKEGIACRVSHWGTSVRAFAYRSSLTRRSHPLSVHALSPFYMQRIYR